MNYEEWDFPRELWYRLPDWEIAVKVATFVPVIALGVCGNALLLVIIARNRALQTPTNLLLANMSAADLLTVLVCPVLFMFNNFYQDFRLGEPGCLMEGFLEGALLVTGVLNLCAVSYDRLTAIVLPRETRITVCGAKLVMVGTWLVGGAFATPLAIFRFYRERQWRNYLETYCSENPTILPTYWHILIGAIVWLPLTVMVACYTAILWKLDRYEAQVLRREHPICVSYKTRVAKTLFVVVLTFVVLRVPFTVMVFARHNLLTGQAGVINQVDGSFSVLWYTSHYLIFLHAAVNPLIYGLTNDNFRRAYSQTPILPEFCRRQAKTKTPSTGPAAAGGQRGGAGGGGGAATNRNRNQQQPNKEDGQAGAKPASHAIKCPASAIHPRLFQKLQPRSASACQTPPNERRAWWGRSRAGHARLRNSGVSSASCGGGGGAVANDAGASRATVVTNVLPSMTTTMTVGDLANSAAGGQAGQIVAVGEAAAVGVYRVTGEERMM